MRYFDESSKTALRSWAVCSTLMSMLVLLPWWLGAVSLNQVTDSFSTAFRVAAVVTMFGAMRRYEHVGNGPLNGWDQSIAFSGLATVSHMLQPAAG